MAKYVQPGNVIDYVNGGEAKIEAGDVVAFGGRFGIAACDIAVGATGTIALSGVFEFAKASGAVALGDVVYWDATNEKVTTTVTNNTPIGVCVKAEVSGATTIRVALSEAKLAANCAKAASTAPTKAEFDAVIDALVAAGIMAPSAG